MTARWWILLTTALGAVTLAPSAAGSIPREPASAARAGVLVLRGVDGQNLRPFKLRQDSNLVWRAPQGAGSNFIISTSQDTPVNALGPTHGRSFLEKGRYTGVSIIASGPWTIRITPARQRHVRRSYTFRGIDGMNLAPFRVTHGSRLVWSAPKGADSNFILSTDQDVIVNALGPTHGKSFVEPGLYTGASITASGPWTIRIR